MDNKKLIFILVAVSVLTAGGASFWYWQSRKATTTVPTINTFTLNPTLSTSNATTSVVQEAGGSIGAVIFEKTQDPLKDKLPETNPLKRVIINPF